MGETITSLVKEKSWTQIFKDQKCPGINVFFRITEELMYIVTELIENDQSPFLSQM